MKFWWFNLLFLSLFLFFSPSFSHILSGGSKNKPPAIQVSAPGLSGDYRVLHKISLLFSGVPLHCMKAPRLLEIRSVSEMDTCETRKEKEKKHGIFQNKNVCFMIEKVGIKQGWHQLFLIVFYFH